MNFKFQGEGKLTQNGAVYEGEWNENKLIQSIDYSQDTYAFNNSAKP